MLAQNSQEKSFLTKNFLLYKLNLEPKVIRLTKSLLLELSCFPKLKGETPESEPGQFFEGIMKVLEWRLVGQITEEEFSMLYSEWLRTKGFDEICVEFQYLNIASNNQIAVYLKNFIPNKNELDSKLTLMMDYLSVHYNNSLISSGVSEEDIDLMEEFYLNFDEEGVGHIEYHKAVFLFLSILIQAEEPSGMRIFSLKENFRKFMKEAEAFEGKITLRGFKHYFMRNGIGDKETLIALKKISENLMKEFNQIYYPKTANSRKGFPDIFNVAFVAAAQNLNNVKIPNYDINHIKKTLPNLNIYYVFLIERYFVLYSHFPDELQKGRVDDNFLDHTTGILYQDFISYFGEDFIESFHFKVQNELLKKFYLELEREFEQIFKSFLLFVHKENMEMEQTLLSSVHESKKLFIKLKNSKNENEEKKRRITFSNELESVPRNYYMSQQKASQSVLEKTRDAIQEQEKVILNPFSNRPQVQSIPLTLLKQSSLGEGASYASEKENIQNFNSNQTPIKKENRNSQPSSAKHPQPQAQPVALNSARSNNSVSNQGQNFAFERLNEEVTTTFSTPWKPNNPQLQQLDRELEALFREEETIRTIPPSSFKKQANGPQRQQQAWGFRETGVKATHVEADKINTAFNIVHANGDSPTTQQTYYHVRSISSTLNNKMNSNGKMTFGQVDDRESFYSMPAFPNRFNSDSVNNSNISENGYLRKPRDFVENNVLKVKKLYNEKYGGSVSFDSVMNNNSESFKKSPISPFKMQNSFMNELKKNTEYPGAAINGKYDQTPNKRTLNVPLLFQNTEDQIYNQDVSVLENASVNRLEGKNIFEDEMMRVKNPNVRYFDMVGSNQMDFATSQQHIDNIYLEPRNQEKVPTLPVRKLQSAGRTHNNLNGERQQEISQASTSEVMGDNKFHKQNHYKNTANTTSGKPPLINNFNTVSAKENSINVNLNLSAFQKKGSQSRNSSDFGDQAQSFRNQRPPIDKVKYPIGIALSEQKEKLNILQTGDQSSRQSSDRKEKPDGMPNLSNINKNVNLSKKPSIPSPIQSQNQRMSDKLKKLSPSYANYKIEAFEKVIKRLNNKTLSADRVKKPFH